ncbi:MAG: hypothetical protein EA428_13440 [Spirochaetaceae bacterium]|nr:MAG: hypothetical protein EA428_13440 [Spirochaetaceae bacterium]
MNFCSLSRRMARLGLATVVLLGLSAVQLTAFEPTGLNQVTFVNRTGYEMRHIFFSPADSDYWGADILGADRVLADREELRFFVSYPEQCASFDFLGIDEDLDTYSALGFELCDDAPRTFVIDMEYFEGDMGQPEFSVLQLENTLPTDIYFLFVSPSDSGMWGVDVLDSQSIFAPGESVEVLVLLGGDGRFDIMAVDSAMDNYSFSVELEEVGQYQFPIEESDRAEAAE